MVGKNNTLLVEQKRRDKRCRYGIRKLSVGVASVLLGVGFFAGNSVAHADTADVSNDNKDVDIESGNKIDTSQDVYGTQQTNASQTAGVQTEDTSTQANVPSSATVENKISSQVASEVPASQNSVNSSKKENNLEVSSATPASFQGMLENKAAVNNTQKETYPGVTIPVNQDGNKNKKLVGQGRPAVTTLSDGSTLTTRYDQIDDKNSSTFLTFKSSSFNAGDVYTIKIPKKGGLLLTEADVAKLQPSFGTTTFSDTDANWYVITDKFINSGTVSQTIKLSRGLIDTSLFSSDDNEWNQHFNFGAYELTENNVSFGKNTTDEVKLKQILITSGYSLLTGTEYNKNVIFPGGNGSSLVLNDSSFQIPIHLQLVDASRFQRNTSFNLLTLSFSSLPAYLMPQSVEIQGLDGSKILKNVVDNSVIFSRSDLSKVSFSYNYQYAFLPININCKINAPADLFDDHNKLDTSLLANAVKISASDLNNVSYESTFSVGSFIVINGVNHLTDGDVFNYTQGFIADYYDNQHAANETISSYTIPVVGKHKNTEDIFSTNQLGNSLFDRSIKSNILNYETDNVDFSFSIPDGLNFVSVQEKGSSAPRLRILNDFSDYSVILTVSYTDGTSFVTQNYADSNDFNVLLPTDKRSIRTVDVRLSRFKNGSVQLALPRSYSGFAFSNQYADKTPVRPGDLFTIKGSTTVGNATPASFDYAYVRAINHNSDASFCPDMTKVSYQTDKTPGTVDAGYVRYSISGSGKNKIINLSHPVFYIQIPKNAIIASSLSDSIDVNSFVVTKDSFEPLKDVTITPKNVSVIGLDDGSRFIKVDLSDQIFETAKLSVNVHYANALDLQSSSESSLFFIKVDNGDKFNNVLDLNTPLGSSDLINGLVKLKDALDVDFNYSLSGENEARNSVRALLEKENLDGSSLFTNTKDLNGSRVDLSSKDKWSVEFSSDFPVWDILTSDGMTSATMTSGNKTFTPGMDVKQDDHGQSADQFDVYGSIINATDVTIPTGATQIINLPDVSDRHSEFNPQLTGSIKFVNANTGEDLSGLVDITYGTELSNLADLNGATVKNPLSADQVIDWSKIKSVMIRFKQPLPKRTSARAVLHLKDPQIYDHVGKTIYVSNLVFANNSTFSPIQPNDSLPFIMLAAVNTSDSDYHLQPLLIEAGSPASARLTVEGQSTVTTWVHYKDASGKDRYVQLLDKSKTYNELQDTMKRTDFMQSDNDLTSADKALLPDHFVINWNVQPTIQNSTNTYLGGYRNGTAEFGKLVKYDFDGDRVVFEGAIEPQVTENKIIKRTIHYKYADGTTAKPDVVQTSKQFNNVGFKNPFTDKITWATNIDSDMLAKVDSPVISGYRVDKNSVNSITVNMNSNDSEETVVYTPDIQHATINYFDDTTGKALKSDSVSGNSDSAIEYQTKGQIDQYVSQHYVLVSNDFNDGHENYDHDGNTTQVFNVHLKHDVKTVSDSQTKKLVVHYVYANNQPKSGQAHADQNANDIVFARTGTTDLVTNNTTWNSWNNTSQIFNAVDSPVVAGYTPDIASVNGIVIAPDGQALTEKVVTYKADGQKIAVNYIDDVTKQTLKSDQLTGLSGASANYNTKGLINSYQNQGYALVSDDTKGNNLVFDTDVNADQIYNVHLTHHKSNTSRRSTVNETINYVYANGKQAAPSYHAKAIVFTQAGVKDDVTGEIVWKSVDSQAFVSVKSPAVAGYTADITKVPAQTVNFGDKDTVKTVTYKANSQKLDVVFIDDVTGQILKMVTKTGDSDTDSGYTTKADIDDYKVKHYDLVSDSTNGKLLVFDHDDTKDQRYEVHLTHHKSDVSRQSTVNETINYVYAKDQSRTGQAADSFKAKPIVFAQTGIKDDVTGDIIWDKVDARQFVKVTSPVIGGYTADILEVPVQTVNFGEKDIVKTVTYKADSQTIVVNYIDDITKQTLTTKTLTGLSDSNANYSTKDNIKNYQNQGYQLVSDETKGQNLVFDHDTGKDQVYNVHFTHAKKDVSRQGTVNEVIHYVYVNGLGRTGQAADDYHATPIVFVQTGVKDDVTGEIVWNKVDSQQFAEVVSPVISGYTPDLLKVDAINVNFGDQDVEKTVVYNANEQKLDVIFIDDFTGQVLKTVNKTGLSDTNSGYDTKADIDGYVTKHYDLVSDSTDGKTLVFNHDDTKVQHYEVHLTHHKSDVSRQSTVNEVIHYVYANGNKASDDYTAKPITFIQMGVKDDVAGEIAWNKVDSQQFSKVTSPIINGYTADVLEVPVQMVNFGDQDLTKTVTYQANEQRLKVVFIDDVTGQTLQIVDKTGLSDTDSGYNTKADIDGYAAKHYVLVSDSTDGKTLMFDHDDHQNQYYEVHLKHGVHAINDVSKVDERIDYQLKDGTKVFDNYVSSVSFARDGYHDEVTDRDHWNAWQPGDVQTFAKVDSPQKQGYTPDQTQIDAINVNPGDKDINKVVIYVPDEQKIVVNYIDDDAKKVLHTDNLTGVSDQVSDYATKPAIDNFASQHYVLVSDDTNGQKLMFDHDDDKVQVYNVHFKHGHQLVNDQNKVNEVVHYVFTDGKMAYVDFNAQPVEFTRTGSKDLITNEIAWDNWTPDYQQFNEVISPIIAGYTPNMTVVNAIKVNAGDKDMVQTVIYASNKQAMVINYIDDATGKTLHTDTLTGVSDQISDYTTKPTIDGYVSQHYKLVSDDTKGQTLTFDHDDVKTQVYNVHLTHTHSKVSRQSTVNETINYVYQGGVTAADSYHAKPIIFTQTGDKDDVTGEVAWNKIDSQEFVSVKSPVISGYTADVAEVPARTVSFGGDDIVKTVTYKADSQKLVVDFIDDTTGKTLQSVVKYGLSNENSDYNTVSDINKYQGMHYELVSDDTNQKNLFFDHDDNVDQHYEVHLKHHIDNVTDTKEVTETIHYRYQDGTSAANDKVMKVNFTRKGQHDLVTDATTWNNWTSDKGEFDAVNSPEIDGYMPDIKVIDGVEVTPDDQDIDKVVIYSKDKVAVPDVPEETPEIPATGADKVVEAPMTSEKTVFKPVAFKMTQEKETVQQLPQTGNEDSAGLAVLGFIGLTTGLGFAMKRKHN